MRNWNAINTPTTGTVTPAWLIFNITAKNTAVGKGMPNHADFFILAIISLFVILVLKMGDVDE